MLVTSIFSFSHNVFYPSQNKFPVFQTHLFWGLQMLSIWTSLKMCCLCYGKPLLQAWLLPDLNTIPDKCVIILFSSVVMVLAFGAQGHWFKSCPDLIFLPCIYSFVSVLQTSFVRFVKEVKGW